MGSIAVGERNKMLDAITGQTDYTKSAAVYAKLHKGAPGAAGTANPATDTTRQQVTFGTPSDAGAVASTADVSWTNLATSDPDTITHVSFWTHATTGTFLGSDDLPASQDVNDGEGLTIVAGDISLTVT